MKIDLTKTFIDITKTDGSLVESGSSEPLTLGRMIYMAANYAVSKPDVSSESRFQLSRISHMVLTSSDIDVSAAELATIIVIIKSLPIQPAYLIFVASEMLEGEV